MYMTSNEVDFLFSLIKPEYNVLEYGSGASTIEIAKRCRRLTSVEHDLNWYNNIKQKLDGSVEYIFAAPNNINWEKQYNSSGLKNAAGDDGTFEDFIDYVLSPLKSKHKPFDLVIVDGRARVSCAFVATLVLNQANPDARILIHDFGPSTPHPFLSYRTYYDIVLTFLTVDKFVDKLYSFKVK